MFIGEYNHTVDSKGRVSIPARFREDLSDTFYITRGPENCLFIYDEEGWKNIDGTIRSLTLTASNARAFARLFYSGAMELSLDRQGRVLIPPNLRNYAGIEKDVVITGVSSRIELWSKEKWDAYIGAQDMSAVTDALHDTGL
uniref:division/cell wall cluster transcriptional repressor MraZ n=1 Tax=Ndongobacter massiliensis TaxID=1871025 RepID=UPI0009318A2C|nr:division/cell wall cluster transcriptional repressor MraZ [Ndongobacter massiliensis]